MSPRAAGRAAAGRAETTGPGAIAGLTATRALLERVLMNYRNAPNLFLLTLAAPFGLMLIFGFVFGGALSGGDAGDHFATLMPAILVLVSAMGLTSTAGTAHADLRNGFTDRVRALPIPPVAAPTGLALAETIVGALALVLMAGAGLLLGWRTEVGPSALVAAAALLLCFRWVLAWLGIALGAAFRDEQMLQQVAPLIFGALMLSNAFVPTSTMPAPVAAVAEWNPVSAVVAALRELLAGQVLPAEAAWPLQHPVPAAWCWLALLLMIAVPAALRGYRAG